MDIVDLTRPCDVCGGMIGGGFRRCLKCGFFFCDLCSFDLIRLQPVEALGCCPVCGRKLKATYA